MEEKKNAITGVIGLFSGRPNPELSMTGGSAEKFVELIKATIGKEPIHPPPPARLGYYYGFIVHLPKELAKRYELPTEISVYHGVVSVPKKREQEHWRDVGGAEQFLISQAREQGYGDMLDQAGATKPE